MSVPKPQRVRKAHDFQLARTQGQVVHCKAFVFQLRIGLGSQKFAPIWGDCQSACGECG